ncbi:MAG: SDR family NAD(P)-dependent oxidoreductase, partial [bacterium]
MDLHIKNKLALVTGASRGIGRAIAASLAREGARLILVARSQEQLEVVRKEIATTDQKHYCYAIDLMAEDGVACLIKSITTDLGDPDIIVHNLGGSFGIPAFSPSEDWKKVWQFNVGIGH